MASPKARRGKYNNLETLNLGQDFIEQGFPLWKTRTKRYNKIHEGLKEFFFLDDNRFLFYNDLLENVYNKNNKLFPERFKLFSVCDMSFMFV